jgi:(2Fe-2S) ferredoxin
MMVYPEVVHNAGLTIDDIPNLVEDNFLKGRVAKKFIFTEEAPTDEELSAPTPKEIRVVLQNCGKIDPNNIEDYIAEDGYMALSRVLTETTPEVPPVLIDFAKFYVIKKEPLGGEA